LKTGSRQQPDTEDWSREADWQAGHAAPMLGCCGMWAAGCGLCVGHD